MNKKLTFHEKSTDITLSKEAKLQSTQLNTILLIEMQIYFSCLLGKRLAFYTKNDVKGCWKVDDELFDNMLNDSQQLNDNIFIRFNTVMTKDCPVSDYVGPPPVTDFKINNQKPYVPDWLVIDYKKGNWLGDYGWSASDRGMSNTKQVRGDAK